MGLLEDLQTKADVNGDGSLSPEDLTSIGEQNGLDAQALEDLKSKLDPNGDGAFNLQDIQDSLGGNLPDLGNVTEGGFGGIIEQIKNRFL
jgi:hypothetical protein